MALSTRTLGILLSVVLSAGMISAAFFLSSPHGPNVADAGTTEELLRAYAKQDSDGDQLADWQEELYGANPNNPNSLDPEMTDREAVDSGKVEPKFKSDVSLLDEELDEDMPGIDAGPETLTDRFAKEFFSDYLTGDPSGIPTEDDLISFVDGEIEELFAENEARSVYTGNTSKIVPGGSAALKAYAAAIERVIAENAIQTDQSELLYFAEVVHEGDVSKLEKVRAIGEAYKATADALQQVSVPVEVKNSHVRIVNTMTRMSTIVGNMAEYEKDPLLAFVSVQSYEATITDLATSFGEMYPLYITAQVTFTEGEAGSSFYNMLQIIASQLQN
jgi:hypothetical protein